MQDRCSQEWLASLFPGMLAAGTAGTRNMIGRARANQGEAGAYGSMVDDLGRSVDQFADEIAAGGSRNNIVTNRRMLDILGEECLAQMATGNWLSMRPLAG